MEKLMEIARKHADKVEIYADTRSSDEVSFENSRLKDIDSSMQSGVGLTLIKDGKLGFAYTRNLIDREALVQNALDAIKGGVEAGYDLPLTKDLPELATYDPAIEQLSPTGMVDECERVCAHFKDKTKGQFNVSSGRTVTTVRVINSAGTDVSSQESSYYTYAALYYPGSYSSISRINIAKKFEPVGDDDLNYILETYNASLTELKPESGRARVMFLPMTLYALVWRIKAGANGKSVYEKVSPLKDKLGKKVLSDKLTLTDQPQDDRWPGARSFDDEGTACTEFPLIDKGVLKSFYCDRFYAWKNKVEPTGHGFRSGATSRAVPEMEHLVIEPGDRSFADLLREMDTGIIVGGVLGAHSGNILHGDFSIGLAPALRVEGGEIIGHIKDAMVAGNIYETMQHVIAVGDTLYPAYMGKFPAVLFDNVSFATKK